jgi:NAD(P)-dependent dehydrogenase (short-subunit alcohol dehydrogenase family)
MGRLEGKAVVITGAAGGMGREAALLFSGEGARVCVADLPVAEEAGNRAAGECREAFFFGVDVAEPASVREMYAETARRFGGVDVLYNNAGIMPADDDSVLVTEPEAWDRVQAVNTRGVYLCCKYGIPYLLERGGG